MYATAWVTASIAQAHGIQLLTIVLFLFGVAGNLFLQGALAATSEGEDPQVVVSGAFSAT
jgi:hypothetical protein